MSKRKFYGSLFAASLSVIFILAGCSVAPVATTDKQVRDRIEADKRKLYENQEPVTRPVDFNEATARALKYNLDYRLKLMESALASGLADVSRMDMLPKVVASAGYTTRNNDSGGTSIGIETGTVSLIPSTSEERHHATGRVEFSWNVLDFGMSYYRARQQSDQVLIAEERRRRVIQNITQDVRSAYWRALGAQRLSGRAEELLVKVRSALDRSREAEAQGLIAPVQALTYQRALLDAISTLTARRQELELAKRELAALMNTPNTDFKLAEIAEPALPQVPGNMPELEDLALRNRPELREEDYRKRISIDEAHRQMLSFLPNFNIAAGWAGDTNRYLYNANWAEASTQVAFNLVRLLSLPAQQRVAKAQEDADDMRRLALSVAVLMQVRVATQRYQLALNDLEIVDESSRVDQRLANYAQASLNARTDSELEMVRTEARALSAEFQRYAAYANAQAALGRVINSVGLDVLPNNVENNNVDALARGLADKLKQLESETLHGSAPVQTALPALKLQLDYPNAALAQKMREAVARTLTRNRITLSEDQKAPILNMSFEIKQNAQGIQRAQWTIALRSADGKELGHSAYATALTADPAPASLLAFAEAAALSETRKFKDWLQSSSK